MKQFKYYSTFATKHIRIVVPEENSKQLALASLKDLKDVLPPNLDIEGNPDLIFNCFNAFLANRVNLNDDGIGTQDAISIASKFIHKPYDLEHNRKYVVGSCISQGFSEYLTNRVLTVDEVKGLTSHFNVTLGGVVWSVFNPEFAEELVESSDETSPKYETISASWEIGFDECHIALGSRDLADAEIITDPKQIEEFLPLLKIAQGSGKTKDGVSVYRIITGEALPLGVGYTTTPAAQVKGVHIIQANRTDTASKIQADTIELSNDTVIKFGESSIQVNKISDALSKLIKASTQQNIEEKEKNKKNSSHVENVAVKINSIMKPFKKLEDITDESLQEANAAAVRNFVGQHISEKIDELSTEYATKLEAETKAKKEAEAKEKEIQERLEQTLAEVTKLQDNLKKEQDARAAQQAENDFNARMTDLDSKFDLNDKDRSYIAKDIRGLDDQAYTAWVEKFEVFAAKKKKVVDDAEDDPAKGGDSGADEDMEDKKKKKAKASVEQVLNTTKENEDSQLPPNNPVTDPPSVKQEFAEAFKLEAFKIKK